MDEPNLLYVTWWDGVVQVNCNEIDSIVTPTDTIIHIGSGLHVAIGKVDFDIQIVLSAAQVIVSGNDFEVEHSDRASGVALE